MCAFRATCSQFKPAQLVINENIRLLYKFRKVDIKLSMECMRIMTQKMPPKKLIKIK